MCVRGTIFCHVQYASVNNMRPCFWPKLSEKNFNFNSITYLFMFRYLFFVL